MLNLSDRQLEAFSAAVRQSAGRDEVLAAASNVYRALQDAIDLRRPLCSASGRCCNFEQFGHRLFVTTIEMAAFLRELPPMVHGMTLGEGCPFQIGKLCNVHRIRPFGCRVFFCDETAAEWQQEQYAFFHRELKRLHEELCVPYFYVEWREALRAVSHVVCPHGL